MAMMINYLAVLVSAVIYIALGAFWYSPIGFGKTWEKLSKMSMKDMNSNKALGYILTFIGSFLASWVIAMVISFAGAVTITSGIITALWLWLGFVATTTLNPTLWEKKPWGLYLLNNAYHLVSFIIMGAIIGGW